MNNNSTQKQKSRTHASVGPTEDLIAGGIAGTASVAIGHPFDTIKVRLQLGENRLGNFQSLFRGLTAPLVTAAAVNAVMFTSYGWSSRTWNESFLKEWTKLRVFACGSFAGLVQCIVVCPVEHLKCRLQAQEKISTSLARIRGPYGLTYHILHNYGFGTLFRGWSVTCCRDVPIFGLYFMIYDACKAAIEKHPSMQNNSHLWVSSALAGGICGSTTWALAFPLDVIKSKIQTSPLESNRAEDREIWHVGKKILRQGGPKAMFNGLGITVLRAFPVNGIIFFIYEKIISEFLKRR